MTKTRNFADKIREKLANNPDLAALVEEEAFNAHVATEIYDSRKAAGLTQQELAERIGSHQSVVARLENADYGSHSLSMLKRIAEALDRKVRVEFYAKPEAIAATTTEQPLPPPMWAEQRKWTTGVHVVGHQLEKAS